MDLSIEESTRITTINDRMITERDHNINWIKINIGIGEVTITIRDRLQRHDKIHPSWVLADNPDQIHLTVQCLTDLEIKTRAIIYRTTKNSQLPTTVTNQTWFDSLQQTMKLLIYWDHAL